MLRAKAQLSYFLVKLSLRHNGLIIHDKLILSVFKYLKYACIKLFLHTYTLSNIYKTCKHSTQSIYKL